VITGNAEIRLRFSFEGDPKEVQRQLEDAVTDLGVLLPQLNAFPSLTDFRWRQPTTTQGDAAHA
jgi:hypothetical protein